MDTQGWRTYAELLAASKQLAEDEAAGSDNPIIRAQRRISRLIFQADIMSDSLRNATQAADIMWSHALLGIGLWLRRIDAELDLALDAQKKDTEEAIEEAFESAAQHADAPPCPIP